MRREKSDVGYFVIFVLILIGFYLVIRYYPYQSREVVVVDCQPIENYYEVTVEDSDGELWSYYSDNYTEPGIINVLFDNDKIVDVK